MRKNEAYALAASIFMIAIMIAAFLHIKKTMEFHESGGCLMDGRKLSKEEINQRVIKSYITNLLKDTNEHNKSSDGRAYVAIFNQDLTNQKIAGIVNEYERHPDRDLLQEISAHPIHEESQLPIKIHNGTTILQISPRSLYVVATRTSSIQEEQADSPASQSWINIYHGFIGARYSYESKIFSIACCSKQDFILGKSRQHHTESIKESLTQQPPKEIIHISNCGKIKD